MLKVLGFNVLLKLNIMYLNDLSYLPNDLSISVGIYDLSKHAVCYTQ